MNNKQAEPTPEDVSRAAAVMGRRGGRVKSEAKLAQLRAISKLPRPGARGNKNARKNKSEQQ